MKLRLQQEKKPQYDLGNYHTSTKASKRQKGHRSGVRVLESAPGFLKNMNRRDRKRGKQNKSDKCSSDNNNWLDHLNYSSSSTGIAPPPTQPPHFNQAQPLQKQGRSGGVGELRERGARENLEANAHGHK
ncbi:hypothetical protein M5D96_003622 [Drosophila gunungcola]|uniref:Uncharacterized protein n=1 Tax=Drosophila gunungcola TaxID=103775 RepID=A0A9Q0BSI8_9MUSC|nr:hypothetical protein M5D96_003622 [Drosophila gunungcola]